MSTKFWMEKARENVRAAKILQREACYDIAASRAYYAMFYIAQALLFTKGLVYSKHSAVIAAFGKEFAKTGLLDSKFHSRLVGAQDDRNLSDYGANVNFPAIEAQKLIDQAEEFLTAAEAYLT